MWKNLSYIQLSKYGSEAQENNFGKVLPPMLQYKRKFNLWTFFQEVDFAVDDFSVTKERWKVVDFMTPFWMESVSLAIKTPEENKLTIYVRVFSVCNLRPLFKILLCD